MKRFKKYWGRSSAFVLLAISSVSADAQTIVSDNKDVEKAFKLAIQVVEGNERDGILAAGGDYGGEWTRDIAINSWNAASLLWPEVAEKSLWSVTINKDSIGHQYWDKIIWSIAALHHYYVNGDRAFLQQAFTCTKNTMLQLENTQFDQQSGLFMGPSVFNDGIAGYPEPVFDPSNLSTFVLDHRNSHRIKCLSTNATYYEAYRVLEKMSQILRTNEDGQFRSKATRLKDNILKNLYSANTNTFNYLLDHTGKADRSQEALGISFAAFFDILDIKKAKDVIAKAHVSKFGIPSVYPDFPRYSADTPGRHNNIIWPMVNGFYAKAAIHTGNYDRFEHELSSLTHLAIDKDKGNMDFREIYSPYTGAAFGGWQSNKLTLSCRRQTWSATAYIDMILYGVVGMRFDNADGITFRPYMPSDISRIQINKVRYRGRYLNISVEGKGSKIKAMYVNGAKASNATVGHLPQQNNDIRIVMM
ncbi:MGH1-like glycoside hydrolase domain-containing protein [Arcticibacter tournemirensis]|uniref:Alpha-L-rhamnosidase six-hairpin glycosidase domain-containing protein n=1 Tax=Arcticibacter tournemirensis TaxID=699437 RepID=A0A4Q0MF03_9SPHI|nr:glycosyl hydrolase family 65 protein [Arcticibacter tournemirensis]RXF71865.1 hypothetical protein EKH83_04040 [Arcticibacter tournemirensis]